MLSKFDIKGNKGISKIVIIIIAAVVAIALIAGILFFVINANGKQNTTQAEQEVELVWDTNNIITLEEKNKLKNEYLGIYSVLISNKYQTDEENLVETASQLVKMKSESDMESVTATNMPIATPTPTSTPDVKTSSVENTTSETQTVINDTIVITGDNPLLPSPSPNLSPSPSPNSDKNQNSTILDEQKVETAISEIGDDTVSDLDVILQRNTKNIVPGFVTEIESISKSNGVYDITYKVCWPEKKDIIEYVKMDKINTKALDKLETTTVNIQLTRNKTSKYSEYKVKSITEIDKETPVAYYISYTNNKYGVIDENGNVIIDNLYDWVIIPNSYKDIFLCQNISGNTATTTVLNKDGEQIYEGYENISVIQSAYLENWWYEDDFLVYQLDGKYGAIDYDGFEIFEPIYDKIEPLLYVEGKIILTQNGKQALADITGKERSNFKYTKIGLLGGQIPAESYVSGTRTIESIEQMLQSGLNIAGQDSNGVTEVIDTVSISEYDTYIKNLPKLATPSTIGTWMYYLLNGYVIYYK